MLGELVRRMELIPALDRAIETAPSVGGLRPVKQRARGCSPGQAAGRGRRVDAVRRRLDARSGAAARRCGGRRVARGRRDAGGVDGVPAGQAVTGARICAPPSGRSRPARTAWTCQLGRRVDAAVTLDFDSTRVEVYGRNKPGAGGQLPGPVGLSAAVVLVGAARPAAGDRAAGRDRTPHAARSRGSCSGACWTTCPTATARSPPASTPASTASICSPTAAHAGCASRSRCRARARCGRRWSASTRTPGRPADGLTDAEVAETTYTPDGLAARAAAADRPPRRAPGRRALG